MNALLLAAGRGQRAGQPKAWLEHEGRPLLKRQVSFLLGLFAPENVFVSIQSDWLARCRHISGAVRWIDADADLPAFDSLRRLITASGAGDWALVYHVDMPVWEPALFGALIDRAPRTRAQALAPRFSGRRGHPVALSAQAQADLIESARPDARLDLWLRTIEVEDVDVPFGCVIENWNEGVPRG